MQGADGNFYCTTELGGAFGLGTIFKVSPSGTFTLLYSFTGGNDGAEPIPGLTLGVDGNFYGNTITGGSGGYGTIFQLTPSGTLNTLYSFTGGTDGANPWGGLMQASDGNLYGTCQGGGAYGYGTVFRIAPTGSLVPLVQFDGYEGANPSAALVQATDGNLYGTALQGGSDGYGAIYKLSISGALQITGQPADQSVYLGGTALFTVATFGSSPALAALSPSSFKSASARRVPSVRSRPRRAAPLWMAAALKRPRALGMARRVETLAPPPDSPKIVTLPGSPPNAAILSRTQERAAIMSSMPALPECIHRAPPMSSRCRKPKMLRR